jgi:hypothetical protein
MDIAQVQPAAHCPRCGGDNKCGYAGDLPCWCATEFSSVMALPKQPQGCYCRRCLTELIEERRRAGDAI